MSITLVAVLAAVVVPTIASQIKKADPSRTGQDFIAIRGAVEQFLTDVRKYPKDFTQLTSLITISQTPVNSSVVYGTADIARWRGPYLNRDATAALSTGYGLTANATFSYDSLSTTGTASCTGNGCGTRYMVLAVPMIANDSATISELDRQFDDGVTTGGVIRYRMCAVAAPTACSPGTAKDTLKFLIMPIY